MSIRQRPGVLAFALTTAVLVPAGLSILQAGPKEVARLVRPGQSELTLDGAVVKLTSDKAIIDAGGTVHVTLTASADRPKDVKVALLVEEARGSNGGRVPDPPYTIAKESVELHAVPGGGPAREYTFKLRGYIGSSIGGDAEFGQYTIFAMPPKTAKRFEHLINKDDDSLWSFYNDGNNDDAQNQEAARVEVRTLARSRMVRMEIPSGVEIGKPFTVAVVVKNPTHKPLTDFRVSLATPYLGADYLGLADEEVDVQGDGKIARIEGNKEARVEFTVTVKTPGLLGLDARVDTEDGMRWDTVLDAVDVAPALPGVAHAAL